MPDFSVIGVGSVGWAVVHGLCKQGYSYAVYDIQGEYDWTPVLDTQIAFICTSTPTDGNGNLNCDSITDTLKMLSRDKYPGLVVVKSTVSIGYMKDSIDKFSNLKLVYMPEFLRERSCFSWFVNPDRIVIGGPEKLAQEALKYFDWVNNAEIIITDFESAELGKLAHNSFIATKVTFTNEIERISEDFNANPIDAMKIVWSDRRIASSEHLTPGLGPYGGKCVKKDINELIERSDSRLLHTVKQINEGIHQSETMVQYPPIAVLIPTNHDFEYLKRSLGSVLSQTYTPTKIIIVSDDDYKHTAELESWLKQFDDSNICFPIQNTRTKNLSGAINTALDFLNSNAFENIGFVALLDDDDWWESRYLENCIKYSHEKNTDWIISGLIRYDDTKSTGYRQDIPSQITVSDFLIGNPNIQGSNLFVRFSALNDVNGFDENLPSTTDRDVSIRLLQQETTYSILYNHLVHHDAFDRPSRLSYPGSDKKKVGLTRFYAKYSYLMTEGQQSDFKQRAQTLFGIDIQEG